MNRRSCISHADPRPASLHTVLYAPLIYLTSTVFRPQPSRTAPYSTLRRICAATLSLLFGYTKVGRGGGFPEKASIPRIGWRTLVEAVGFEEISRETTSLSIESIMSARRARFVERSASAGGCSLSPIHISHNCAKFNDISSKTRELIAVRLGRSVYLAQEKRR